MDGLQSLDASFFGQRMICFGDAAFAAHYLLMYRSYRLRGAGLYHVQLAPTFGSSATDQMNLWRSQIEAKIGMARDGGRLKWPKNRQVQELSYDDS